jgi:hypothetical protein
MEKNSLFSSAVWGIFIGIGIIIAGISISNALYKTRAAQRYVTVKGLAEQEVDADLAIWPITFKDASNDLVRLQKNIDTKRELTTNFLTESGFKSTDISNSAPRILDTQAENHYGQRSTSQYRYIAQTTITLRSENVSLVKQAMEKSAILVGKGIVLVAEGWENRTEFLYTSLNQIKPDMIEEATINARKAAEKFAQDSGSKVGKIRNATQGLFTINDRDTNTRDRKKVRVVTTVQYFLIDD